MDCLVGYFLLAIVLALVALKSYYLRNWVTYFENHTLNLELRLRFEFPSDPALRLPNSNSWFLVKKCLLEEGMEIFLSLQSRISFSLIDHFCNQIDIFWMVKGLFFLVPEFAQFLYSSSGLTTPKECSLD
jgi:hypothetical protein